jgi:hypothetical protein
VWLSKSDCRHPVVGLHIGSCAAAGNDIASLSVGDSLSGAAGTSDRTALVESIKWSLEGISSTHRCMQVEFATLLASKLPEAPANVDGSLLSACVGCETEFLSAFVRVFCLVSLANSLYVATRTECNKLRWH